MAAGVVEAERNEVLHGPARACCPALSAGRAGARGLFDDLIGAGEQGRWHFEAERLGGLEVDDGVELGGLLDWKIPRALHP